MGSSPPLGAMENEDMFESKKDYRSPLVPIGAFATAGVLIAGLYSFKQGKSHRSQLLMRARVLMQGATVALMHFRHLAEYMFQLPQVLQEARYCRWMDAFEQHGDGHLLSNE